jgi:hypothetical protein
MSDRHPFDGVDIREPTGPRGLSSVPVAVAVDASRELLLSRLATG